MWGGGGGQQVFFKPLYLNDNSEMDNKISMLSVLHDYPLMFKISTVRTFALRQDIFHDREASKEC